MTKEKDLTSQRRATYWALINKQDNHITEDWAEDALNQKPLEYWNMNGFNLFFAPTFIETVNYWRLKQAIRVKEIEEYGLKTYGEELTAIKMEDKFDDYW